MCRPPGALAECFEQQADLKIHSRPCGCRSAVVRLGRPSCHPRLGLRSSSGPSTANAVALKMQLMNSGVGFPACAMMICTRAVRADRSDSHAARSVRRRPRNPRRRRTYGEISSVPPESVEMIVAALERPEIGSGPRCHLPMSQVRNPLSSESRVRRLPRAGPRSCSQLGLFQGPTPASIEIAPL